MQMQAARMYGYQEPLRIEEVPVPEPGPDEILLKVAATGMCRSDYSCAAVTAGGWALALQEASPSTWAWSYGINVRDKSTEAIQDELERLTGRRTID